MDKTNALSLTGGGMFDGGWTPVWLIKDEFTDTLAAGSVDGTAATPGPGTRTVTDTESKLSVGSGVLAISGGKASPAYGDPGIWYGAQSRAAGLATIAKLAIGSGTNSAAIVGWDTNQTTAVASGVNFYATNDLRGQITSASSVVLGSFADATDYTIASIVRSAGSLQFIKGGAFFEWTLLWVSTVETPTYPGVSFYDAPASFDYLRVLQLPAPFDTDDGLATDTHSGSVAAGTAFTHTADMLLEFVITTIPTSAAQAGVVEFRKQDSSNYWRVAWNNSGLIALDEIVSSASTNRGVVLGVLSSGHRVVVVASSTTIKIYSNDILRITYSSASNFLTATSGKMTTAGTGGVVSNLKTWQRTLSGTAASILNKASA